MTNSEGSRASQRRMVEGESSNARERRLKMQADLKRMDQRMEESDAEDIESEQGEFEIGVNLVQEEGNGLQVKKEVMRLRVKRKEKR
ncbi:unnamed protein product [Microthlaspi erraticum]|uniref:Uncharacterized protein n=1 Tax=Microthlaspi erraticum TaxID=1685480 RepID=A0A6D2JXJ3_9BRAS|nr:unnamed protein product [Microthlaspi erraticum]